MIKLSPFGGLVPRTGERLLPDTAATIAENVKLQSGELRPIHQPGTAVVPTTPKTLPPLSIFKARDGTSSSAWFTWPIDVDCVRVPLDTDVESRFCWTGDGAPKMAVYSAAVGGGANNYPLLANELMLGIPTPQTAPTVTPSGGVGAADTRFYCYTFCSALGEESAPSPLSAETTGKVDDTWALSALDTAPANSGTGTAAYGSVTTFTTTAAAKHWLQVGDEIYFTAGAGIVTTLLHTVATVPSATTFTVTGDYNTATAWSRKTAWNTSGMVKYIYRTVGTSGGYQLVNATGLAAATTTYNDTLTDAQIAGDDLVSSGWIPPPVGLTGLAVHSSGALVGFVNNLMCFSEPLQPHAWPAAYQLSSGYSGVGIATYGSSVVMATAGPPFVASGVEPASMSGEDVTGMYPCLAKRSVISHGGAVLYASKFGLVEVGSQGVKIFTEQFYTRDEWELLYPSTMISASANGRVYVAYTNAVSTQAMLIFDGDLHTTCSAEAYELYSDLSSGEMYLGTSSGIQLWDDTTETVYSGDWRSKEFISAPPINLGAAKVDFVLAVDADLAAAITAAIAAATAANELLSDPAVVTISSANPGVVTWSGNTLQVDDSVVFLTTGALPTNIVAGTRYYVHATGYTAATSFSVSETVGGARIDTTAGAQSGVHTSRSCIDLGAYISDPYIAEYYIGGDDFVDVPEAPASNEVTFNLFHGDELLVSRVISDTRAFRLPAGYKADDFLVQVITQCQVKEIRVAETMDGLRDA